MPKNDIGGFFLSLGLNPDKNSFETGNKLIDGVTTSFNKLIGTARNVAVVLTGMATGSGVVESSTYKTANAIGTTTEKLDQWKAAAKIAGVSAGGLVGSMSQLASVMNHIKVNGAGLSEYAKKLGELHMGMNEIGDLDNMDRADAYAAIIRKAQEELKNNPEAQLRINTIVGDILGDAGQNLFIELSRQNKSIDEFLQQAKSTIFTTAKDNENGQNFLNEINTLRAATESMTKLFGDSIGKELTGYVKDINTWISENKDEITYGIKTIASGVGKIAEKIASVVSWIFTPGDQKEDQHSLNILLESFKTKTFGKPSYKNLNENAKNQVAIYYEKYKSLNNLSVIDVDMMDIESRIQKIKDDERKRTESFNKNKSTANPNVPWHEEGGIGGINDGIIRPDGTVTKVAPDDWVFAAKDLGKFSQAFIPQNHNSVSTPDDWDLAAKIVDDMAQEFNPKNYNNVNVAPNVWDLAAKNVGDLARAFIPQNMSAAPATAQYSIVQNFTISGSNDIPQVLKQQAYNGVQDGLMQMMSRSSQRLQMMSGTR